MKKRFPKVTPTRWNFNSIVETVYEYRSELIAMFENVIEDPDNWDSETYITAQGFLFVLKDFTFNFLLTTFKNVFTLTTILSHILQTESNDISFCIQKVTEAKENIASRRGNFEELFSETFLNEEKNEPLSKRLWLDNVRDVEKCFRELYDLILDNVVDQIEQRFQNLNKLKFFELISPSRSRDYERAFPGLAFSSIKTVYGQHFIIHRLNSELHVYYSNENLRNKNVSELLLYLKTTSIGSAL